jgi:1,2-diacylglycerol 3-beta-glucosyltransferase
MSASRPTALLTAIGVWLAVITAHLMVLTVAALRHRPRIPPPGPARRRFALLIPAHNEEAVIGRLLESVRRLDYPADRVEVYVVADNCSDDTAGRARALGAAVYERSDCFPQGKGAALRWLVEQIQPVLESQAFVVLDADSVVDANLLRAMDARLEAGSRVVQAHYSVLNAEESPVAALRYAALAAVHYLRPLGRSALGLSCGLKGNGLCLAGPVLRRFGWSWDGLAEDAQLHLTLVREGIRVDFAPETAVRADMPVTFTQATSQNVRWERGRLQLLRQVPALLGHGLARRDPLALDASVEQLIPPLSVPFVVGGLCLVAAVLARSALLGSLAAASLVGQVLYVLAALALVRAPRRIYRALCYAPIYIVWKLWIYIRAIFGWRSAGWIRTARVVRSSGA